MLHFVFFARSLSYALSCSFSSSFELFSHTFLLTKFNRNVFLFCVYVFHLEYRDFLLLSYFAFSVSFFKSTLVYSFMKSRYFTSFDFFSARKYSLITLPSRRVLVSVWGVDVISSQSYYEHVLVFFDSDVPRSAVISTERVRSARVRGVRIISGPSILKTKAGSKLKTSFPFKSPSPPSFILERTTSLFQARFDKSRMRCLCASL